MLVHMPVLLNEALNYLNPQQGGCFIDATVGAGGHAAAILERTSPGGRLLGIDRDESALELANRRLASFGSRVILMKGNFRDVWTIAQQHGFVDVDGILADLGISSMMVDDAARGFSFLQEGPLDMRMDRSQELTAAEIVNTYPEREIADILFRYGEERRSRAVARAIVRARPLRTTTGLAGVIGSVLGRPRYAQIHPATRTFQALRIAVNGELENLESFLDTGTAVLRAGGRMVAISFHSLEDRIVKRKFRVLGRVLTKKVVTASEGELRSNPRVRSAKLRALEKEKLQ